MGCLRHLLLGAALAAQFAPSAAQVRAASALPAARQPGGERRVVSAILSR